LAGAGNGRLSADRFSSRFGDYPIGEDAMHIANANSHRPAGKSPRQAMSALVPAFATVRTMAP
jgi:hypothetical protein